VRDYLNNTFSEHMDRHSCTETLGATLPHLTPLDFFAWGFFKSNVYRTKVPELHDLRQRIYEASQALTSNMLRDVFRATVERWEHCLGMEGVQVELY
jgi:hypothetical protein